jgi:hypothetical protein
MRGGIGKKKEKRKKKIFFLEMKIPWERSKLLVDVLKWVFVPSN